MTRVGVVGGGIAGMATAFHLARAGVEVELFEASDHFGGLGSFFQYRDSYLERFYHCILPSDHSLLEIIDALGIRDRTYWRTAEFGFLDGTQVRGLNTPLELLRFTPLSFLDRIRVGLTGFMGLYASGDGLDDIDVATWLRRISGQRAFDIFWKPMLKAKFGDAYTSVPALWFWTRLRREKGAGKEVKGYVKGGYKFLIEQLAEYLSDCGVKFHLTTPVTQLRLAPDSGVEINWREGAARFDSVVLATPLNFVRWLTRDESFAGHLDHINLDVESQGVINVVLLLRRSITSHYYWVAAIDDTLPFQGIVESSVLLDRADSAGMHLVYLMRYLHRDDDFFALPDEEIIERYIEALLKIQPQLSKADIVDKFVFRAPFVEPRYTLGYSKRKPPICVIPRTLFLATSAQVYPEITSWNGSATLAKRVAGELLSMR